jgi:hypothetical protein
VKSLANITWYCACVSVVARLKRKDIREIGVSGCVLMFLFGMTVVHSTSRLCFFWIITEPGDWRMDVNVSL